MDAPNDARQRARSTRRNASPLELLDALRRSQIEVNHTRDNRQTPPQRKRMTARYGVVPSDLDRIAQCDTAQDVLLTLNEVLQLLQRSGWKDQMPAELHVEQFESMGEIRSALRTMNHVTNAPDGELLAGTDAMVILRTLLDAAGDRFRHME